MKNFKLLLVGAAITPILALGGTPYITDLTAGGGQGHGVDIGDVIVNNDDINISVEYSIESPIDLTLPIEENIGNWCMTGYHVDIQNEVGDIPQTKKNSPKIGHFGYKSETVANCTGVTVEVPNTWDAPDIVAIAAHAEVKKLVGVEADLTFEGMWSINLPQQVDLTIFPGITTYLQSQVDNSAGLDGRYNSWCVDSNYPIDTNVRYEDVYAVSSYSKHFLEYPYDPSTDPDSAPDEEDHSEYIGLHMTSPDRLPMVNYALNMLDAGEAPYNTYSVCDVQQAFWMIINGAYAEHCLADFNQDNADAIVADALQHGEFEPDCGERMAIIMIGDPENPDQTEIQTTIIDILVPCKGIWQDETAWGGPYPDFRFNENDWAIWFPYTIQ